MLDSSPPAIVVGRTLSAYSVADIQNNQETITYTVYNQQADTESDVVLSHDAPERRQLYERLAGSGPERADPVVEPGIDRGLRQRERQRHGHARERDADPARLRSPGHGDARRVSRSRRPRRPRCSARRTMTPRCSLPRRTRIRAIPTSRRKRPSSITIRIRSSRSCATISATTAYFGALLGARGTLWTGAGNSLDKASLLVALLRASGVPAEYQQGTLSVTQAQSLILSMFPTPTSLAGCIDPGTTLADPADESAAAQRVGEPLLGRVRPRTPALWRPTPTSRARRSVRPLPRPTSTFAAVPDDLHQQVEITVQAELTSDAAALVPIASPQSVSTVLDETFDDVALVGVPITYGNYVSTQSVGALEFSATTNTYTPYLRIDNTSADLGSDTVDTGTNFQEVLSNFPFSSEILTGLFLNVTLLPATGSRRSRRRSRKPSSTGSESRRSGAMRPTGSLSISPDSPPALNALSSTTLLISAATQPASTLVQATQTFGAVADQLDQADADATGGTTEQQVAGGECVVASAGGCV